MSDSNRSTKQYKPSKLSGTFKLVGEILNDPQKKIEELEKLVTEQQETILRLNREIELLKYLKG